MTERYLKNTLNIPSINDANPEMLDHFVKLNTEKILFNYPISHYSRDHSVYDGKYLLFK
jgi:hypothetical protein